jgi:exosortase
VGYLIFCIPLNFLDVIAFPLRIFAAKISAGLMQALGVDLLREGSALKAIDAFGHEKWAVDVAAPCSGLRSLLAMTALTSVYAWVTQNAQWKKWLLFLSSIPLAIAGNVGRIVTIGLVAEAFGQKLATGPVHDFSGYVVFVVGITLMISLGAMLKSKPRRWWRHWRSRMMTPVAAGG